jgi:hypothetical protein
MSGASAIKSSASSVHDLPFSILEISLKYYDQNIRRHGIDL